MQIQTFPSDEIWKHLNHEIIFVFGMGSNVGISYPPSSGDAYKYYPPNNSRHIHIFTFIMEQPLPFEKYIERVETCVRKRNGEEFVRLLSLKSIPGRQAAEIYLLHGGSLQTARLHELGEEWADLPEIIQNRFAAGNALVLPNFEESCTYLAQALSSYLNIVAKEDSWTLPLMQSFCQDLRILAEQADAALRARGGKVCKMEQVERILKRAFSVTNNDRRDVSEFSRRIGTLAVINQLLKVYFKLNNLRLCANIIRAVDAPNFPDFEATFPISERVTYKYFVGRLHLYDERISQAVEALQYAFDRTPDVYRSQKRMQLLYLVPARLHTGYLPPISLLEKYDMKCYLDIVRALRKGDLSLFNDAMKLHQNFFISSALYLVLENIRPLVYRALIRLICDVAGTPKLKIETVTKCFEACGVHLEKQEVECIIANLIYNSYLKGYIAHKLGYLVLSKKDPFPDLSS